MSVLLLMLCFTASPAQYASEPRAQGAAPPRRVAYTEPQFPAAALEVSPPLQGIVVLQLTLNEEGRADQNLTDIAEQSVNQEARA